MEILVRGKNMDVSPALKNHAEKKLSKIDKYLRQSALSCQATFSTERDNYVLEVTVALNGYLLRAEESARDALTVLDLVMEKLERQIEKYRTKVLKRDKTDVPLPNHTNSQETGRIVRVKRFPIKPMPPEEATMQMELLGHDFFVFQNAETGSVNVVYRRKDGDYGLIEPEG
ncbi:MAG: ribosome hibernation-promoting factor, HPF/YfiA family [Bacillota bacterium]